MSVDQLVQFPLHVVIGVPANWSPDALLRLREVVGYDGIPGQSPRSTLEFLSEPDAAVLTLLDPRRSGVLPNIGDVITVCYCGGGTADAISYEVLSHNPLSLRECVPGGSCLAGPVLFDDEFLDLIRSKMRPKAAPTKRASITRAAMRKHSFDEWKDTIKPRFSEFWEGYVTEVPFPFINLRNRRRRLARGTPYITLTNGEVKAFFDPAVAQIAGLLKAQLDSVRRAKGKLPEQEYNDNDQQDRGTIRLQVNPISVHNETILAVSHGCSRYALEKHSMNDLVSPARITIKIASRLARASYSFPAHRHDDDDDDDDDNNNNNHPHFLESIAQGESLQADTPKRVPVDLAMVRLATSGGGGGVRFVIYQSSEADRLQGRATKYCEIALTGPAAGAVNMADRLVELTAVAGSAFPPVVFGVHVDGELQQGLHVTISYEQDGLW